MLTEGSALYEVPQNSGRKTHILPHCFAIRILDLMPRSVGTGSTVTPPAGRYAVSRDEIIAEMND